MRLAHILDEAESDKVSCNKPISIGSSDLGLTSVLPPREQVDNAISNKADFCQAGLVWKRSTTAQHAKRLAIAKWEAEENAIKYHFLVLILNLNTDTEPTRY